MSRKAILSLCVCMLSSGVLANGYGENKPWQFPTSNDTLVKMKKMEQIAGFKNGTLSAGAWVGGGGPIGNNVTINYVIEGDNNTISNNDNSIDQDNNGDQQGIFNRNGDIINNNQEPQDNDKEENSDETP